MERTGTIVLMVATLVVAISIVVDGTASRLFNGLGGVAWFASAAILAVATRKTRASIATWGVAFALTALLAFVVTPSDFSRAIVGFGGAGVAIALVSSRNEVLWAKLIVALYLPLHVGTAILKSVWRSVVGGDASIRTDPPPTAALVPMAMLVAAVAGALAVGYLQRRSRGVSRQASVSS